MAKRIINNRVTTKHIQDISPTVAKIDSKQAAEALQAKLIGALTRPGSYPLSVLAIQHELLVRLKSSGGRPGLSEATRRQKIPLTDAEWEKLQQLTDQLAILHVITTPGQIASILIHCALKQLDEVGSIP